MSEEQAVAPEEQTETTVQTQEPQTSETKTETPTEQTPEQRASDQAAKDAKKKAYESRGVQMRIDKITRARYEAETEARLLRERLARYEQQGPAPAARTVDGEPKINDYDNFDDYVAAKSEYIADKRIEQKLTEREQRQAAERAATERNKTVGEWQKRVEKATAEMPDFEDVILSSAVPMTDAMQQAIMEADKGPQLAYYLATHEDEAAKIAAMSPIGAIRELGRIEERLANPTAKKTTDAPPPLTPIGSSGKVQKAPEEMSQSEFEKWRKQYKAKR